ncbi:MAG: hypothetical protein ACRDOI_16455 [Trebonia sp.]
MLLQVAVQDIGQLTEKREADLLPLPWALSALPDGAEAARDISTIRDPEPQIVFDFNLMIGHAAEPPTLEAGGSAAGLQLAVKRDP